MTVIQQGLFGNDTVVKEKTFEEKYKAVLSSKRWTLLKAEYKNAYGNKCSDCGISGLSKRLELHHFDYKHLGRETIDDVMLLCPDCHAKADLEREIDTDAQSEANKFNAVFEKAWDTRRCNLIEEGYQNEDYLYNKREEFRHYLFCKFFHVTLWSKLPKKIDGYFIQEMWER